LDFSEACWSLPAQANETASDVTPALGPFLFAATPESDRDMPAVLTAAEMLTNAAEHGGPAELARIGTLQALISSRRPRIQSRT
jgi:hypothetical protein